MPYPPRLPRAVAALAIAALGLGLGALAAAPAPAGAQQSGIMPTITVPKTQFDHGERFRACFTFGAPASVVITQKIEGQREIRLFRRFVGDRTLDQGITERRECLGVVAGSTDTRCTYDVVGLETTPCFSGESGTECLHIAVLTPLEYSSDGGQRLVLVQDVRSCYSVG